MDEKKKGKKKETSDGNEGHKKPWQEVYATPEEIKAMLANRVSLRYNEVRGRWPSTDWYVGRSWTPCCPRNSTS